MLNRGYIYRDSRIHKMSPASKIMCTILFIVASFMADSLRLNIILLFLLSLIIFNTKIPFRYYLSPIIKLRWILGLIAVIMILLGSSGIIILNICLILIYLSVLVRTTPFNEIVYALETILWPLKLIGLPVKKMALNLTLVFKFFPIMFEEKQKLVKTFANRGLKDKSKMRKSLFRLTFRRMDKLSEAMEVRLYDVNKKRINFRQNPWGIYDGILVLFHMIMLIGVMF